MFNKQQFQKGSGQRRRHCINCFSNATVCRVAVILVIFISSCAIPRHSVLLFQLEQPKEARLRKPISNDWSGRLLKISSDKKTHIGGDSLHNHNIVHQHTAASTGSELNGKPLGLKKQVVSGKHVHQAATNAIHDTVSKPAVYMPSYVNLIAYETLSTGNKILPGLIVGFIGKDIPKGWVVCSDEDAVHFDMQYIRIVNRIPSQSNGGSNNHRHDVTHTHDWVVQYPEESGINKALAGDIYPPIEPSEGVSLFNHVHTTSEIPPQTWSDSSSFFPPSLSIRFIKAIQSHRKLPSGTVLPANRSSKPIFGWKRLAKKVKGSAGDFLVSNSNKELLLKQIGESTHTHSFQSLHKTTMLSNPKDAIRINLHAGPPVSLATHTHKLETGMKVQTGPSSSLPVYIEFPFIIKK